MMSEQIVIDYWLSVKEIINKVCKDYDKLWQRRDRILNSKIIISMILKIILSDRRQGLTINLTEFWDCCSEKGLLTPNPRNFRRV